MPNGAHLHLMLNHLPVVGIPLVALLLAAALSLRNRDVTRVALVGCTLVALTAAPAFLTGEQAEEVVEELPAVSHDQIHEHEEWAERSIWLVALLGVGGIAGLVMDHRRSGDLPRAIVPTLLVIALVASVLLMVTATQGGRISHPEIRPGFEAPVEQS